MFCSFKHHLLCAIYNHASLRALPPQNIFTYRYTWLNVALFLWGLTARNFIRVFVFVWFTQTIPQRTHQFNLNTQIIFSVLNFNIRPIIGLFNSNFQKLHQTLHVESNLGGCSLNHTKMAFHKPVQFIYIYIYIYI